MANPGKNKLLRYTRLFVGGYDLSGDSRNLDSLDNSYTAVDLTGWSEAVRNGLADMLRATGVRGYQAYINDLAAGAFGVLKEPAAGLELSVLLGGNAEPVTGDPAYILAGVQLSAQASFESAAGVLKADFVPEAGIEQGNPLGVVLFNDALTATTNGSSVDNGAATSAGLHANLHITVTGSGNYAFKIQHSTDNSTWVDLVSFTITGGALASEHVSVSGTVNRYLRGVATRTGGTCTAVMSAARN